MLDEEFKDWLYQPHVFGARWAIDQAFHNGASGRSLMFYRGTDHGISVMIHKDGHAYFCRYSRAVPCLEQANFTTVHTIKFQTYYKAIGFLVGEIGEEIVNAFESVGYAQAHAD